MNTLPESGPLVLVVEDELLIATTLEIILEAHDYRILGPVATVEEAMALLENNRPDMALLDYRLARTTTEPLLPLLAQQCVPVCILSGYGRQQLPVSYAECALLEKPFRTAALLAALQALGERPSV
ncbi:MAG: response regulator [Rhodanobacter sp.]|nr:MAG: response regulator [Rhodanobacter sp.]TAL88986.1 MAG: response regulator [Rhodanobacter sp.]TAM40398.1 MAG: response regulator [Rhodanobacter sp.]TAN23223.1 MAG: response regulator [Rhodanobacter sp.]